MARLPMRCPRGALPLARRRTSTLRPCATLGIAALCLACRPAATDGAPSSPQPPASTEASTETEPPALPREPPEHAERNLDGVAFVLLEAGDAAAPKPQSSDLVELRYRVWDEEGRLVGQSRPGRSERLAVSWLPRGWAQIVMWVHPGAHAHVWVPEELAYGPETGGPRGALRIDMELVAVEAVELDAASGVPLQEPPPNALRTASGISFVVLRPGTGTRHATPEGRVTVHYAGWTASDGKPFDSSYERGQPATFPLPAVIEGWKEAVTLMVEGEKTRFWIPGDLAYGDAKGRPNGMLVFDIELVRIED